MRHEGNTAAAADGNPPPFVHAVGAASGPPSVMRGMAAGNGRNAVFLSLFAFLRKIGTTYLLSTTYN